MSSSKLSLSFLVFFLAVPIDAIDANRNFPADPTAATPRLETVSWSLFSPSTWLGGHAHLGTGEVKVRVDASKLGKGVLFLDEIDLKSSSTGIIVRPPGVAALRSAVPGWLHDWRPTEYCRIVVHADQLTIVDVALTGRTVRNPDGSLSSKPVCKCLIQDRDTNTSDGEAVRTCE